MKNLIKSKFSLFASELLALTSTTEGFCYLRFNWRIFISLIFTTLQRSKIDYYKLKIWANYENIFFSFLFMAASNSYELTIFVHIIIYLSAIINIFLRCAKETYKHSFKKAKLMFKNQLKPLLRYAYEFWSGSSLNNVMHNILLVSKSYTWKKRKKSIIFLNK